MSWSGESTQYSSPAPAGEARGINTDAGATPAPPARGRGREGDAGGRREVGHAGMPDQFASVIIRSDIRLTWDERTEVEEAEPAAEAALRCGARRVDQIANLNQYSF